MNSATIFIGIVFFVLLLLCLALLSPALYLWLKTRGKSKGELYDLLYSLDWGETTTNNFGYAPADGDGDERYQLQMYREIHRLYHHCAQTNGPERLLEVSCGRGGGLAQLVTLWDPTPFSVGLDFSVNALEFCRRRYLKTGDPWFVAGSAVELPFEDASFDVIVNVEASHVYSDVPDFLREVYRVLRPHGAFLYADYRRPHHAEDLEQLLRETGFDGSFRDITDNVIQSCELDSERRRRLIQSTAPWFIRWLTGPRLKSYARLKGSAKLGRFQSREQIYFMTCMTKVSA
ncbi:MAG: class I SAM-dependent methyltransferase [Pseudomonadota bacterium]